MSIEASPKLRLRGKRQGATPGPEKREPKIVQRARTQPRQIWAINVLVLLVVGLVAAKTISDHNNQPDPHFVIARDLVEQYEYGRPLPARNYEHGIYKTAMNELLVVDPDSVSAFAARELASRLEKSIAKYRAARDARQQRGADNLRKGAQRASAQYHARSMSRIQPEPDYVECNEGEDHAH
jgi:hypothetical protein